MTLYELREDYRLLLDMAEDPDTDPEVFADTLEGLEGAIEDKADGYAMVMRQMSVDADGIKAEIDRLTKRKKAIEGSVQRMRDSLKEAMELTGKTKFKTGLFSFGIQKNPPSLKLDVEEDKVPAKYRIPQPDKIDSKAIKDAINAGASYDWCHMEQTESLRIR